MAEPVDTPIVVNPNPTPAQVWVAVRDAMKIIGGVLVTKGVIDTATLETIIGVTLILGPVIYAQFRARRTVAKLTVLADAAPDRIAVVADGPHARR